MKIFPVILAALVLLLMGCQSGEPDNRGSSNGGGLTSQNIGGNDSLLLVDEMGNQDRENWQKPQMVISRLGDLSAKTVADIGAGTGYFTMRLARKARKVIAIDIDEDFLAYINRRISSTRDGDKLNVETRLTVEDDPNLQPGEADLVLVVNTYAYIGDRVAYFSKVKSGMAPGGSLVIIDFKKQMLPVGPPPEDKVSYQMVQMQLDSAGFSPIEVDTSSLDYQFTVTARLPEG